MFDNWTFKLKVDDWKFCTQPGERGGVFGPVCDGLNIPVTESPIVRPILNDACHKQMSPRRESKLSG